MPEQQSFYLESRGVRLAASLIMPADDVRRLLLVAQPLMEERKAALLPIVEASRSLADRLGFAVLRVDYPGTGDSEGDFSDFGPDDWISALAAAADWLRGQFGALPFACLGIRTGAALLTSSQSDFVRNAPKVLWDPVSGEEAVKQWLQRHMVNDMVAYGKARVSRSALEATLAGGGSADLDGFELTGAQYAGLSKLGLGKVSARMQAIVSGRPSAATAKWSEAHAGSVELLQLRTPPYWNSVGYVDTKELRDATETWLGVEGTGNGERGMGSGEHPPTVKPSNRQTVKPLTNISSPLRATAVSFEAF